MPGKKEDMITIEKNTEVLSSVDRVWDIVSNTDEDQEYWNGLRNVKVISKDGNIIEREAEVGPRAFGQRTKQTLVLDPKKSIRLRMKGEATAGERSLVLVPLGKNNTRVEVSWKLDLFDVPAFVRGIVKGQISRATEDALKKIKAEAERPAEAMKVSRRTD